MQRPTSRTGVACASLAAICAFLATRDAAAAWLDEAQIRAAAEAFSSRDAIGSSVLSGRALQSLVARDKLWIARYEPSGYAVFAGSDLVGPVIVFSDKDYVEPAEGEAFYAVLKGASAGCVNVETAEETPDGLRRRAKWQKLLAKTQTRLLKSLRSDAQSLTQVAPFMTAHWNQNQPYNDFTPVYYAAGDSPSGYTYRGRVPVGCVAAATAQVLYHWKWPVRVDEARQYEHSFNTGEHGTTTYSIRFDGHVPFDWSAMSDAYASSGSGTSDMRGSVSESTRYHIARLLQYCDSLGSMQFASDASNSSFDNMLPNVPGYTKYTKYTLGNSYDENYTNAVAALRADMIAGRPVPVGIPGHAVVAHGWQETADDSYVYLNYGWGGAAGDNYYNLDDRTSGSSVNDIYVGFQPKPLAQINPLAAVSSPTAGANLSWQIPACWRNSGSITGCQVVAYSPDMSAVTSHYDDFSSVCGESSNEGISVSDGTLGFMPLGVGTYTWGERYLVTARSVLTFSYSSRYAGGRRLLVEAKFDDGDWTPIAVPALVNDTDSDAWRKVRVFLGDHGGQSVKFRVRCEPYGASYYPATFPVILVDDFRVTDLCPMTATRYACAPGNTWYWFEDVQPGTKYWFTVELATDDGTVVESEAVSTTVAGEYVRPLPGAETYAPTNLAYSASSNDGTWTVDGTNPTDTSIKTSYWEGGFSCRIDGSLCADSSLDFEWTAKGYYGNDASYDTITVDFISDGGVMTQLCVLTNTTDQSNRQPFSLSLGDLSGQRGEICVKFVHAGSQYAADDFGMTFYTPQVSAVMAPVLPEATFGTESVVFSWPNQWFDSITHTKSSIVDDLFAECSMGGNVFHVKCPDSYISLEAHVSAASYIPDSAIKVYNLGSGAFVVTVDASGIPAWAGRTRAILTLAATEAMGSTLYKDLSLRFSNETASDTYVPPFTTQEWSGPFGGAAAWSGANWDGGSTFTDGNAALFNTPNAIANVDGDYELTRLTLNKGATLTGTGTLSVTNIEAVGTASIDCNLAGGFTKSGPGTLTLGAVPANAAMNVSRGSLALGATVASTGAISVEGTDATLKILADSSPLSIASLSFAAYTSLELEIGPSGGFRPLNIGTLTLPSGEYDYAGLLVDETTMVGYRRYEVPGIVLTAEEMSRRAFRETRSINVEYSDDGKVYAYKEPLLLTDNNGTLRVVNTLNGCPDVIIPERITNIYDNVFYGNTELTSIVIPATVTNIGVNVFRDCTALTNVTFLGDAPVVGEGAFDGVHADCVATVGKDALGFDTDESGKWHGLTVVRETFPIYVVLGDVHSDTELADGTVLTGTLTNAVSLTIAAGATITLRDVSIGAAVNLYSGPGLRCLGDATIILEGTNTVKSSIAAGIQPGPAGTTLTIRGDGVLHATGQGAGIGASTYGTCGNITIEGGTVTANGGNGAAGIGGAYYGSCGDILIKGGNVAANGGYNGAGIGCGYGSTCGSIRIQGGNVVARGDYGAAGVGGAVEGSCGTITVTPTVESFVAHKGEGAAACVGPGSGDSSSSTIWVGYTAGPVKGDSYRYETESYDDWCARKGVTGDWDEEDVSGLPNVFRYVFDMEPEDFATTPLINIEMGADGKVIIKTPSQVRPCPYDIEVKILDNLGDDPDEADDEELPLNGRLEIDSSGKSQRFFRLEATMRK